MKVRLRRPQRKLRTRPWGVPARLWRYQAAIPPVRIAGKVVFLPARVYLSFCDALLFKVWWYSWPLDAWIERWVLEVPEDQRHFS